MIERAFLKRERLDVNAMVFQHFIEW
jgi:hypothetical protein